MMQPVYYPISTDVHDILHYTSFKYAICTLYKLVLAEAIIIIFVQVESGNGG